MRIISTKHLPEEAYNHVIIKSHDYNRYKRMALALERTIIKCNEIKTIYNAELTRAREESEQQGCIFGFNLIVTQMLQTLELYEKQQNERFNKFRESICNAVDESLQDASIVELIVKKIEECTGQLKPVRVIIPEGVRILTPENSALYQYGEENQITVQNDLFSVRFPSDALCQQWLSAADHAIQKENKKLRNILPGLLLDLSEQFINVSQEMINETSNVKEIVQ